MTIQFSDLPLLRAELPQGIVEYREVGEGRPLLFVHGLLVNGNLWRKVIPALAPHFRCIVPDWPLGAHRQPIEGDTSPGGVAQMVVDFIEALALNDVTLIGNDTGGAVSQVVVTQHPERVSRLILTNCDAFEHFLPAPLHLFQPLSHLPGFMHLFVWLMRFSLMQRLLIFPLAHHMPERSICESYFQPAQRDPRILADLTTTVQTITNRYTLKAANALFKFQKRVLIVWGTDDMVFRFSFAERLARAFPNAQLKAVAGSRTFVAEDQPSVLAEQIIAFVQEDVPVVQSA